MEIGKPDEAGTMGEEVVGPLNLPRPEGKPEGYLIFLGSLVAFGFSGVAQGLWADDLSIGTGRSKSEAEFAIQLAVGILALSVWVIVIRITNRKKSPTSTPRLVLERRATQNEVENKRFTVWSAHSDFARTLKALAFCLPSTGLLWLALTRSFLFEKIVLSAIAALCLYFFILAIKDIFKPILVLCAQGAKIKGRVLTWEQVQKVEVEHLLSNRGAYFSTRWTFFDLNGQKRAHIFIPKDICPQFREEEMLVFTARRLGHDIPQLSIRN